MFPCPEPVDEAAFGVLGAMLGAAMLRKLWGVEPVGWSQPPAQTLKSSNLYTM